MKSSLYWLLQVFTQNSNCNEKFTLISIKQSQILKLTRKERGVNPLYVGWGSLQITFWQGKTALEHSSSKSLTSVKGRLLASVQFISQSCPTFRSPIDCSTPGFPVHHQFPELAQPHVHRVGDAIQPSHPLSSPSPPTFKLCHIRVFSNVSVLCIRWPKYRSFNFNISLSNEYSRLISFRIDWLDLLAVQGTLKSLLQHHSSIWHSAFFIVQFSHPYMTTGKTISLTRWTFVGKVKSLLFNMLSRLVIAFLPRSKRLLISWLHYRRILYQLSHQGSPPVLLDYTKITEGKAW